MRKRGKVREVERAPKSFWWPYIMSRTIFIFNSLWHWYQCQWRVHCSMYPTFANVYTDTNAYPHTKCSNHLPKINLLANALDIININILIHSTLSYFIRLLFVQLIITFSYVGIGWTQCAALMTISRCWYCLTP